MSFDDGSDDGYFGLAGRQQRVSYTKAVGGCRLFGDHCKKAGELDNCCQVFDNQCWGLHNLC